MSPEVATYLVGSICYGVLTAFGIRMRNGIEVAPSAALAPGVAVAALHVQASGEELWLLAAPVAVLATMLAARRPVLDIAIHIALLRLCMVAVDMGMTVEDGTVRLLVFAGVGTIIYSLGTALGELSLVRARLTDDLKMWLVLHGVLLSGCGLTVLVVRELGAAAFAAMAAALLLCKREFDAYAEARTAYDQTVAALDDLASRG